MTIDLFKRLGWFVFFIIIQVMMLGHLHLFHCATPLFYVYFVLMFPRHHAKWAILVWSFALGLVIDIFLNTPGLAAASLTLLGAIQPYFLELFIPRDAADNLQPSIATMGPAKYTYYVTPLVMLYCIVFYTLEQFSFFNGLYWLMCVVGSVIITLVLILTFEIGRRS